MTVPRTAYTGRLITFATMHGKELLARDVFRNVLGATVTAALDIDTDRFGTFAGDIPRPLSPRDAARAKARVGMHISGSTLGLASEGSFSSGFGPVVENMELLAFIDDTRGLEIVDGIVSISPVPGGRRIANTGEAITFASAIGFPDQGVILQSTNGTSTAAHKNITQLEVLEETVETLLGEHSTVVILPDYRANRAPSRAAVIRTLCGKMAHRLATGCPRCGSPGFGPVSVEYDVPCSLCGSPTREIAADIHGCAACDHQARLARPHTPADPRWCQHCNP